jgi:hypothetical protein
LKNAKKQEIAYCIGAVQVSGKSLSQPSCTVSNSQINSKSIADAMTLNQYWSLFLFIFAGGDSGEQVAKPAAFFYACFVICFKFKLVRKI